MKFQQRTILTSYHTSPSSLPRPCKHFGIIPSSLTLPSIDHTQYYTVMESKPLSTLADGRKNSMHAQDSSKLDTLEKNLHRKRFSPEEKCYMAHHVNQCHDFQHLCRMFHLQFGTVRNLESIEKFLSKCDEKSAYLPRSASESTPSYSVVKASGSATLPKITNGTPWAKPSRGAISPPRKKRSTAVDRSDTSSKAEQTARTQQQLT